MRKFCTETDVGSIKIIHNSSDNNYKCMGVETKMKETLQQIVSCKKLFSDPQRRTIFLRDTVDNFRPASRYPTEQTSFSILNIKKLVNCPYGQLITTLWRGSESREIIFTHVGRHWEELTELTKKGVQLIVDIIVFLNNLT